MTRRSTSSAEPPRRHWALPWITTFLALLPLAAPAAQVTTATTDADPHYTERGFFDLHVCNWPGRPLFYQVLFSTYEYNALEKVEVFDAEGQPLVTIGKERFRLLRNKGKPDKRVFMTQVDVPPGARDGWFSARAIFRDGRNVEATDYVVIEAMQRARDLNPPPDAEDVPVPKRLSWKPIPGARHYQVFIRDLWQDGKLIHSSKLLDKPYLKVPPGLLKPGGLYSWRIHARDVNENVVLGDFNHGSLTGEFTFSTASE